MIDSDAHSPTAAVRGPILHFLADPFDSDERAAYEYFEDGLLLIENGYISKLGRANDLLKGLSRDHPVIDCTGKLILPGFVDAHIHFVQTDIVGSYGRRLLEWLETYTFPAERAFADAAHGAEVADFFLRELLRNGTTTALVLGSVHRTSVEALFEAAVARNMRLIAGKVMMDRNCPDDLRDTATTGYADSRALIERWHRRGRLQYAITPRFAPTSSPAQLSEAGRLAAEYPDAYIHTHLAENEEEVAWVSRLFPERRSYLDVYAHYGLVRRRAVFAHGIWLDEADHSHLAQQDAALVHCPTCNLFMGSGLFDLQRASRAGIRVGLGTDIGGGTSFSLLRVMHDAYKVAQMLGSGLSPLRAFYLATLGGARALDLEPQIGSLRPGIEADLVVLDPAATPLLARRTGQSRDLQELLALLLTLGDDRLVWRTYVSGRLAHARDAGAAASSPVVLAGGGA